MQGMGVGDRSLGWGQGEPVLFSAVLSAPTTEPGASGVHEISVK